jgi:predicted double-glycine peptidase
VEILKYLWQANAANVTLHSPPMTSVTGKIMFFKEKQDTSKNNHVGKKRYKNGMDAFDMKVALP